MGKFKLTGFLFPVIGFIVLVTGLYHLGHGAYAKIAYVPVDATLTSYETHSDSDGDVRYLTNVTYTYEGHTYQDQSYSVQANQPTIGRKLTCLCNPKDPSKLADPGDDFLLGGIFTFMGVIFFFLGMAPLSIALGESPFARISRHVFHRERRVAAKSVFNLETLTFLIFAIAGIGMLLLGGYLLRQGTDAQQNGKKVSALITKVTSQRDSDGDVTHTAYATYTYNNKIYSDIRLSSWSANMKKGNSITVYINPNSPYSPYVPSVDYLLSGLMFFMGTIFSLIGFGKIISALKENKRMQKVYGNGIRIQANVDDIETDYLVSVNNMYPFVIHCSYTDSYTNETYKFVSSQFWDDPEMVFPLDSEIDVIVDPDDYSNYYVDAKEKMDEYYQNS